MKIFGKSISMQGVFTTMATIVSICALVVSVMQTYYQHKYLHAAAWAHVQTAAFRYEGKDSTKNSTTIKIMNKGIGPAIVESVIYEYKGKRIDDVESLLVRIIGKKFEGSYKTISQGEVIAPNEEFNMVSVTGVKARLLSENLVHVKLKIVYSSVHDQRWEYTTDPELPSGSQTIKLN
jgi:prolyl oligopeptidase PreP (S9A serine peptidase family)